ncbi:hypothetical protein UFOVP726_8 [uncultured Caudovirales phage]|uniref:Uncharacterized protein n=1 Tax=uncultured Caudovirales phage TaxID=2100421 RepID=A0A6J5NQZ7_9CAUD|nr:hypothetical protein UFOVP726_8 [uncultured Caudovirales phage]
MPNPPNPNRLARRYMGLLKTAEAQQADDKALGARVRVLLADYAGERAAMVAKIAEQPSKAESIAAAVAAAKAAVSAQIEASPGPVFDALGKREGGAS